jgi:predicted  nucleic acid-binding Zn-ribbon protein
MSARKLRRELRDRDAQVDLLTKAIQIARRNTENAKKDVAEWHGRAERFSDGLQAAARRETRLKLTLAQRDLRIADLEARLKAATAEKQLRPAA